VFSAIAFIIGVAAYVKTGKLSHALSDGSAQTVEGEVMDFHPMPYEGHAMESFSVNGVHFEYSDAMHDVGFSQSASHGGPLRAGLYVKIAYVGNYILRLEIGK
jgi:hypothetical protein